MYEENTSLIISLVGLQDMAGVSCTLDLVTKIDHHTYLLVDDIFSFYSAILMYVKIRYDAEA